MVYQQPISVAARIKVGQQPEQWLGFFRSMSEAVRLLCPPQRYRESTVLATGDIRYHQARQFGGICITDEQAEYRLEHHQFTYNHNNETRTVRLERIV